MAQVPGQPPLGIGAKRLVCSSIDSVNTDMKWVLNISDANGEKRFPSSAHDVVADSLPGSASPTRLPVNEVNRTEDSHPGGGAAAILRTVVCLAWQK
jgi:hypothetical protein